MKTVWTDSFVEEGNLAAIRQRIFGDDADSPLYIETVPRCGYRLVAEVCEIAEDKAEAPGGELSHPAIPSPDDRPRVGRTSVSRPILLAITGVIVLFTVSSGALYFWRESSRLVAQQLRNLRAEASRSLATPWSDGEQYPTITPDGGSFFTIPGRTKV